MSGDLKDMRAYARGYENGRRSKDADHAAVALRLSRLKFDGGSHENLSKIAYAVYPCATGWTCESSKGLRDRLIDLLGGVHEHHHRCYPGRDCACGNRDSGDPGEHAEAVTYDVLDNERQKAVRRLSQWEPDRAFADDNCGEVQIRLLYQFLGLGGAIMMDGADAAKKVRDRLIYLLGGDEPNFTEIAKTINLGVEHDSELMENGENHKIATITDELGNERHKAVCKLRNARDSMSDNLADNVSRIICAIDARPEVGERACEAIADRLIHLLGEDERTLREIGTKLSQASVDAMSRRADQSHESSPMSLENETGITSEFREAIETATKTYEGSWYEMNDADHTICHITEGELLGIADRIEEQFARVCELWERTATDTAQGVHDDMEAECNKLQAECDRLTAALDELHADPANDAICRLERERDDLLELLKDAVTEYQLSNGWSYGAVVSQAISLERERDELMAKLKEADAAIANWRERERSFEESERERDELKAKLDAIREALDGNH